MALYPYLNFGTNCHEAFVRYQEIFGGEVTFMRASDMPSDEAAPGDMSADLVIHASLRFPNGDVLMASDTGDASFGPVTGMYVCHAVADTGEAKRVFDALAEGGAIEMPIAETFFSPMFGVCVDRFGTPWMIDTDTGELSP